MKIGCSSHSFREFFERRELDLLSYVELAVELGLDAVEVLTSHFPSVSTRFLRELEESLTGGPVEISAISPSNNFGHPDAAERDRQCDDLVGWMHVAGDLGVDILRTFTGRVDGNVDAGDAKRWVHACYEKVVPEAERLGVTLAIENHGNLLNSAEELLELVWHFASSSLQLNPDPTNFLPGHFEKPESERGPIYDSLAKVARFTVHSHLKVRDFDEKGVPTNVDVPRLLAIYRKACFDGVISLEYPGGGDAHEVIRKSVAYLRGVLEE